MKFTFPKFGSKREPPVGVPERIIDIDKNMIGTQGFAQLEIMGVLDDGLWASCSWCGYTMQAETYLGLVKERRKHSGRCEAWCSNIYRHNYQRYSYAERLGTRISPCTVCKSGYSGKLGLRFLADIASGHWVVFDTAVHGPRNKWPKSQYES